jgi:hypothetical protein
MRPASNIGIVALLAAATLSACNAPPLDLGVQAGCIETLSGAVTATFGCPTASVAWNSVSNRATMSIPATDSSALVVAIPIAGEPQAGRYTVFDQGTVTGGISLRQGTWFAGVAFPPSGFLTMAGSYTLTLTSVNVASTTSTGRTYLVHGTLEANLVECCISVGTGVAVGLHAVF